MPRAASAPRPSGALPHLLTDDDLAAACAAMHRSLEPCGRLLASIRDYDAEPQGDLPRLIGDRAIVQLWDWIDAERYVLRHLVMRHGAAGWSVTERRTRYRALKRATLTAALRSAGFAEVTWPQTGWYQPVVSARTSSRATATGRTPR